MSGMACNGKRDGMKVDFDKSMLSGRGVGTRTEGSSGVSGSSKYLEPDLGWYPSTRSWDSASRLCIGLGREATSGLDGVLCECRSGVSFRAFDISIR